jgi:hypothetical protein
MSFALRVWLTGCIIMKVWYTFVILLKEISHLNSINVVLYCNSEVQPKKIICNSLSLIVSSGNTCVPIESCLLHNPLLQLIFKHCVYHDLLALGENWAVSGWQWKSCLRIYIWHILMCTSIAVTGGYDSWYGCHCHARYWLWATCRSCSCSRGMIRGILFTACYCYGCCAAS